MKGYDHILEYGLGRLLEVYIVYSPSYIYHSVCYVTFISIPWKSWSFQSCNWRGEKNALFEEGKIYFSNLVLVGIFQQFVL